MTKYSDEFRWKAINLVEEGYSVLSAARMLGIKEKILRRWNANYQAGGPEQLVRKNRSYSPEFKMSVIEYKWEHGLSLMQTVAQFQIPNIGTVYQWERRYLERGMSGLLPKKRGRPSKMPKKPKKKENLTRLEQLEAENAQLRMENEFLKKLDALVQQRKKQPKKN